MYKIIGADGREYGPVTLEQIRQWLTEGRASTQTLVQAVGTDGWKALGTFPELTGATSTTPPPIAPPPVALKMSGQKSKLAAGLLGILLGGWGIHRFYLGFVGMGIAQILVTICTCGLGALWGFIEGILILVGNIDRDAEGRPLKD